jgi:hypothetical protein
MAGVDLDIALDYVSPFCSTSATPTLSDERWDRLSRIYRHTRACLYPKISIFRSLFANTRLSPEQVQDAIRWFPQPYLNNNLGPIDLGLREQSNYDDPRIEMFIACFNLCDDRSGVLSLLYDRTLFTTSEAKRVRIRLGWLPTCDAYRIGKADFLFSSSQNFDLDIFEQRMVAHLIIRVIHNEFGRTPDGEYSKASLVYADGGWQVPVEWSKEIKEGVGGRLTLHVDRFQGRADTDEMRAVREEIIKEVLGWPTLKKYKIKSVSMFQPSIQRICQDWTEDSINTLASNLPDMVRT